MTKYKILVDGFHIDTITVERRMNILLQNAVVYDWTKSRGIGRAGCGLVEVAQ